MSGWDRVTGGLARLAWPILQNRARTSFLKRGGDPARWPERTGHDPTADATGVIWVHAVSVGEMMSALPLIDALLRARPYAQVLLTTGTASAARIAADRLPTGARHRYAPVDHPDAVARFLDTWKPARAIFLESEIWPNQIAALARRGIPLALVSARLTPAAARGWQRSGPIGRAIFARIPLILTQDNDSATRARALGAPDVRVAGSLKTAARPLPVDAAERARMAAAIGDRPVWTAASTHAGEEEIVIDAHARIRDQRPDALLILAPRHRERGPDIAARLGPFPQRSDGALPTDAATYLADTDGELGLWFATSPTVFMGGSLIDGIGGHNPLEPAAFGCTLITGPHTANADADFATLPVTRVTDADTLARNVLDAWRSGPAAPPDPTAATDRADRIARACLDLGT